MPTYRELRITLAHDERENAKGRMVTFYRVAGLQNLLTPKIGSELSTKQVLTMIAEGSCDVLIKETA